MFGAYSVPWLSPPAPHEVRTATAATPMNKRFVKCIFKTLIFLFKTFLICFRSTTALQEVLQFFFALTRIQCQVNCHHVLVIGTANIKLPRPTVRLHITYNHESSHHTQCSQ